MCEALNKISDWFSSQHRDVRMDIAAFIVISLPGMDREQAYGEVDAMIDYVQQWLIPESGSSMANFGKAISFGAIIDTFFVDRFDEENWQQIQAMNEDMLQNPVLKDIAARTLANLPARAAAWQDAGTSWRELAAMWLGQAGCQRFFARNR